MFVLLLAKQSCQNVLKTSGFQRLFPKLICKNCRNTRVFAHFGRASLQKSVKTRCFLRFLKITLAKRRWKHEVFSNFSPDFQENKSKNIVFSAFFYEMDLQKLQKHVGFCTFWASIFSKKAKNSMFFCDFCKASLQKEAENSMFFCTFWPDFGQKRPKTRGFSHFLVKMCRQKFIGA